jgi:polysaccharide pyruvyl transferase WcaK-like protein
MHANISALSTYVPTVAIAWHHKYYGIMKNLKQEKYVFNIKTMTLNDLFNQVNDAWNKREEIRRTLKKRIKTQQELALLNGKLVKEFLSRRYAR